MRNLAADLAHKRAVFAADGASASKLKIFLSDGTSANVLYRIMNACSKKSWLLPFALLAQYLNKLLNQCVIGIKADFGPGFVLMHPVGVIINSKVQGGCNVVLESGVVIGDNHGQSPTLEDNIFVGSGAKIFGDLTVGSNARVGANAVVTRSVETGQTVVGIPAGPLQR